MSTPPMPDAERERRDLLLQLNLPGADAEGDFVDTLTMADREYLHRLLGDPVQRWEQGLSPLAADPVLALLSSSGDGRQALAEDDVVVLHQVIDSGTDVRRRNRFGLVDAAFPLWLQGAVIHCVWIRGYHVGPFADAEIQAIADASGQPLDGARAAADACPVLSEEQETRLSTLARSVRDNLRTAVQEHLNAGDVTQQLLKTERTRALGSLSSGIAHRFNNLLSIILGYSSFVLNRESMSGEASNALRKMSEAAQQGRRLTEEILAFAGSEVEEDVACSVHAILAGILSLLQAQTGSRVRVETHLDAEVDEVVAPPSAVHQLVFNLLTSAIDSMPEGGELRVYSANVPKQEHGKQTMYLSLAITDTSGVSPPGLDDTLAEGALFPRTGLKLSQALGIAGSMDGSVGVTSEPGQTTRVEVRLPIAGDRKTETGLRPGPQPIGPATIWVVDDDAIFRDMCRQVLAEERHAVESMDGGSALQAKWKAAPQPPDLLIIDFSMPEFNGLELCRWLQDQGSDVPVILVSGFSKTQPDIHRALEIRKTYFLRKPFLFREMLDTIAVALGESLIRA